MKKKQSVGIIILLGLIGILVMVGISSMKKIEEPLEIQYFYNNPCGSCNGEETFYKIFNQEVGDLKEQVNYHITTYNIFQESALNVFKKTCEDLQIDEKERRVPMVIVGDQVLVGDETIEEEMRGAFLRGEKESAFRENEEAHLIYFYTQSCKDCERAKDIFNHNEAIQNNTVQLMTLDIGESNVLEQLKAYFKAYKVGEKDQQVPIVFYDSGYLSGYEDIKQHLPELIEQGNLDSKIDIEQGEEVEALTYKDLPKVLLVGLVNGFNPCSLSMLFFLLSLMSIGKPILKLGITYIIGKVTTYFALGTIFYSVMGVLEQGWFRSLTASVNITIIVILFILAGVNLLDYWASRREQYDKIKLQLPVGMRKFNHKIIKGFSKFIDTKYAIGAIFIASMIVSAGEFLCTGQIYLATILYLVKRSVTINSIAFLALFVYVLAMVIPLTVIVIAVSKGQKVMMISEGFRRNMPKVKLVNAIILIVLAILMIGLQ